MSDLIPSVGTSSSASAPAATTAAPAPAVAPAPGGAPAAPGTAVASTSAAATAPGGGGAGQDDYECPSVTVRTGTGTLLVNAPKPAGAEMSASDVRYQATFVRFSRECATRPGTMTMKVGIQGRIISGPAGGPGTVDVPLRIAVVKEGPDPKMVVSKLSRIPVTVAGDAGYVDFTHVDQDVSFPLPRDAIDMESYVVYVGFDPAATAPKPAAPARRKR